MKNDAIIMTMLFDYYGELLTEKQKNCFDLYYNQDFSLGEIASDEGITRQGVHDSILRAENALLEYEEKLCCVQRDVALAEATKQIEAIATRLEKRLDPELKRLAAEIKAALEQMKE